MSATVEASRHLADSTMPERPMKFTYASGDRPLEGYTIRHGIGRGGFGEVYYATSDGGKEVALKLVQRHLDVELRGVGHCLNLKHANLVTLYDVRQADNGDHWVVMEHVAGESLDQVIAACGHRRDAGATARAGRPGETPESGTGVSPVASGMPLPEVRRWLEGICAAVGYLHDRGIVHRDLKPGNIFLEDGTVKVGDYGLAKFISASRRSGQTESIGTVHYMAPEVARGRYGKEIDLYAIGVILYEMLTGRVPFNGESPAEILMKHLMDPPDLSPVPEPYRHVVARLLDKDPLKRYPSVRAMLADLEGRPMVEPDERQETRDVASRLAPLASRPSPPPAPPRVMDAPGPVPVLQVQTGKPKRSMQRRAGLFGTGVGLFIFGLFWVAGPVSVVLSLSVGLVVGGLIGYVPVFGSIGARKGSGGAAALLGTAFGCLVFGLAIAAGAASQAALIGTGAGLIVGGLIPFVPFFGQPDLADDLPSLAPVAEPPPLPLWGRGQGEGEPARPAARLRKARAASGRQVGKAWLLILLSLASGTGAGLLAAGVAMWSTQDWRRAEEMAMFFGPGFGLMTAALLMYLLCGSLRRPHPVWPLFASLFLGAGAGLVLAASILAQRQYGEWGWQLDLVLNFGAMGAGGLVAGIAASYMFYRLDGRFRWRPLVAILLAGGIGMTMAAIVVSEDRARGGDIASFVGPGTGFGALGLAVYLLYFSRLARRHRQRTGGDGGVPLEPAAHETQAWYPPADASADRGV